MADSDTSSEQGYNFEQLRPTMKDIGEELAGIVATAARAAGDAGDAAADALGADRELSAWTGLVFKRVVRAGAGAKVPAKAFVRYHYSAWLDRAPLPFDSTTFRKPRRPDSVRLGEPGGIFLVLYVACLLLLLFLKLIVLWSLLEILPPIKHLILTAL